MKESCDVLEKMFKQKGLYISLTHLPVYPEICDHDHAVVIDVQNADSSIQFICTIIMSCAPCGKFFVEITVCENLRSFTSSRLTIKINSKTGKDYNEIPFMETSYSGKKVTAEVIVADIMWKYNTCTQTFNNTCLN